jgi:hypothetical protein
MNIFKSKKLFEKMHVKYVWCNDLHGLCLSFVEEASPGLVVDLADGLDDGGQALLEVGQEVEKVCRHLRHHA